jgi:adenylylsulfate kinase
MHTAAAASLMNTDNNLTWHEHMVSSATRSALKGHQGALLWFTGLSAAGKSTIANAVDYKLNQRKIHTYLLDGDNVRHGLNSSLGFSAEDRAENIRRIGEVGKLMVDAGLIVCTAFISPYRRDRDAVRATMPAGSFIEIFVDASLATCEARDPKGLYKQARAGKLKQFTGIDDPYEAPERPELILDSDARGIEVLADEIVGYLDNSGLLSP